MQTTGSTERTERPREVTIGVAILAAIYAYGLYHAIAGGFLPFELSQTIAKGYLTLLVTPFLLFGIWFGVGAARVVSVILFFGRLFALAMIANLGATMFSGASLLLMAAQAVGLVLLFLPASNAWFRSRKPRLKRHASYPFALAIGIVFGIPIVLVLLMTMMGPLVGGPGTAIFLALMFLFFIPAVIFGRPHFMFGIGAGPADDTGWVLMIAFYAFIAVLLGAILWLRRERRSRRGMAIVAAVLLGLLVVMIVPQIRDRSELNAKLQARIAADQAKFDATLTDYPELEGPFTIHDEGGHYGIHSTGRWKVAKGKLEIVADSTEIWSRFPKCTSCAVLTGWRFTLRSTRNARPWLGAEERRSGFAQMTDTAGSGPDRRITVTGHRMIVPIAEDVTVEALVGDKLAQGKVLKPMPPAVLANYWMGIELLFMNDATFPVSAANPFIFADALAAKGLVPARCAAPQSVADAVERECHEELSRMLHDPARRSDIEKGDANLRAFSKESTPLRIAVWKKDAKAADILLANGADANRKDISGYTILMTAVTSEAGEVVAVLARHKASLNEQYANPGNDAGKTALIFAANQGNTMAIKMLLAAGADKSIKDRAGYDAYKHAVHFRHAEAATLLK